VILAAACVLTIAVIAFVLLVRPSDLPEAESVSPFAHLDERKASIYENLRDLQFEYRVGKLSDEDYQATKKDLQRELAGVLAEIDALKEKLGVDTATRPAAAKASAAAAAKAASVCPKCRARFAQPMKFCGECGAPMGGQG
jgi:Skp family chaperone for outer membrane proteins